jgi:putative endonuclease
MDKNYFVYILSSRSRNLYTGVTNNLMRRVMQHRQGLIPGFTSKYRIHRLVHIESFTDVRAAIEREKQIKDWRREMRVALIEASNPAWADLAEGWAPRYPSIKADPSPQNRARDDNRNPARNSRHGTARK